MVRYSGIQVFYCIIAFEKAIAKQKLTEKDSNKMTNTKADNKAEDHKKKENIINIPRELFVRVCPLFKEKRYTSRSIEKGKE